LTLVNQLSAHLPFLRRYGRALTGYQSAGDSYVRATLHAIADGKQLLESGLPARVALYQVFHVIWHSSGARLESEQPTETAAGGDANQRLMRLTPRSRQAFLLTALEGFSRAETAQILGAEIADVERLIAAAQSEIEAELTTDVLIIEDEPVIAIDIAALVKELGHKVIGIAATRSEAAAIVAVSTPGLVLADIQLADGSSGIDAVKDILGQFDVPVIFITAFPERLLTGERPEPTFLITKPFRPETVKATIGQALFFHPRGAGGAPSSGGAAAEEGQPDPVLVD
jgi:CheY-like chemotaxis protein